jgi:hypothetical protein
VALETGTPIDWSHSTTLDLIVELSPPAPKIKINALVRYVGATFDIFEVHFNQSFRDVL